MSKKTNPKTNITEVIESWREKVTDELLMILNQSNAEYQELSNENSNILKSISENIASMPNLLELLNKFDENTGRIQAIETEFIYENGLKDGANLIMALKN